MTRPLSPLAYWLIITLQWLALTFMQAAAIIWSSRALEKYIAPTQSTLLFLGTALVGSFLLGLTVRRGVVLGVLTILFCLGAAAIFGATIYSPAWEGTIARVVSFQNYATQQAMFVFIWSMLPASLGAFAGNMIGVGIRQELEPRSNDEPAPWWETRDD
ncbi:MAG: hypothetical protein M9890_03355 [Thermomicrobiales bacterium]|nr:hypothetical protein [Thermomicrobiales bacterium]